MPHNLTSSDGIIFEYNQGNTRNLIGRQNGRVVYTRDLEYWPYDLHIAAHLAVFTLAGLRTGGGKVYAYDIKRDQLVWEFDASQKLPGLSEYTHTDITVDGNRVLVSVDQVLLALAIDSGHVLWMTKLPRQTIRQYDAPWTKIGRLGKLLLVECYEDLFALDADNGKLLWSFDAGPFGEPWPTIKDGRAYVLTREGPVKLASFSFGGLAPEKGISAVKVKRDEASSAGYSIQFISRRDIPRNTVTYWSLKPPPLPSANHLKSGRAILRLVDTDVFDPHSEKETISQLDISVPLHESGAAYVKFTGYGEKAVLVKDGVKILEVRNPESEDVSESEPAVTDRKDFESEDVRIGLQYLEQRQFAEAIPYLERAYRQDSEQASLGEHLAYAYSTLGRYPEAISTLEALVRKLGELSAYGWELLVHSCRQTGQWRRLLDIAEAALTAKPASVHAYHMAGLAASQVYGLRLDEAKKHYTKYLELNPNSEETAFVRQMFPDL